MSFSPTPEQDACRTAALTGQSMVVTAGAGAGKTTMLRDVSHALAPKSGLYLAFGKAIQLDAEDSFPENVVCKTAHAVAYAYGMREFPGLMRRTRIDVKPWEVGNMLRIPRNGVQVGDRMMSQRSIASLVNATVTKFCHTADTAITKRHVPNEFGYGTDAQAQLDTLVTPFAIKAWADLTSDNGQLKFGFDHYLKLWSLACPKLLYDFILFDEAQDADPAIAHVIENQGDTQVIMVGDASQAIYGWRGAVDALSNFNVELRLTLTQSFRFGPQVAEVANQFLGLLDAPIRIEGSGPVGTVGPMTDPDAILCRTNAACIEYAMTAQRNGRKVAICGGTKEIESFCKNADKLMSGKGFVAHPVLSAFDNWQDVREFANSDDGNEIRVMTRLVDEYGTAAILEVCKNSTNEDDADVVVSTAHKAKGREWDSVQVAGDFQRPADGGMPNEAELMLLYVCVTRAKLALDCSSISWVGELVGANV
jgi:hypothetical protein